MKKICLIVLAAIALSVFAIGPSWAGSVDKLIDKLVEKQILTRQEAKELVEQMQAEEAKEAKEKKEVAAASTSTAFSMPDWVANTKVTGDVRVRHETSDTVGDTDSTNPKKAIPDRNRERVRLRLGVQTKINEQWDIGFGLASGSSDPRSNDQTLEDTFSAKDIKLSYAYAQYTPAKWARIMAGKFKNPIWNTNDLIWDPDINPEGAALALKYEAVKNVELFANVCGFTLEEFSGKANDPYMIAVQPGVNFKLPGSMYLKAAGTYYNFNYVDGNDWTKNGGWGLGNSKKSNSQDAAGNWLYDYDSFVGDAEFGITKIPGPIPYASVYGQYVHAIGPRENNDGWLAGLKLGNKDIKDFGDWQVSYNYRRLEKDAWADFLADSNAYNGNTNIKGHKIYTSFGIYKNVSLGLNYFNFEHIQRTYDDTQTVLQADLNVKF